MRPVRLLIEARLILPLDDLGDAFFGVAPGTNGTAAVVRRALVTPPGRWCWLQHNGLDAHGLNLAPASGDDEAWANPWQTRAGEWFRYEVLREEDPEDVEEAAA
jgi:hypothetical protein